MQSYLEITKEALQQHRAHGGEKGSTNNEFNETNEVAIASNQRGTPDNGGIMIEREAIIVLLQRLVSGFQQAHYELTEATIAAQDEEMTPLPQDNSMVYIATGEIDIRISLIDKGLRSKYLTTLAERNSGSVLALGS